MTPWSPSSLTLLHAEASVVLELVARPLVATLQQALERADPPITPLQLRCLHHLEACEGANVGQVAASVGVIASTASRAIDRLVATGLVSRRAHARDRRQVALGLTPAGRRTLAEITAARAGALAAMMERMDEGDRAALVRGAQAFAAASSADQGRQEPS